MLEQIMCDDNKVIIIIMWVTSYVFDAKERVCVVIYVLYQVHFRVANG